MPNHWLMPTSNATYSVSAPVPNNSRPVTITPKGWPHAVKHAPNSPNAAAISAVRAGPIRSTKTPPASASGIEGSE